MKSAYTEFLATKAHKHHFYGFDISIEDINQALFDFQQASVKYLVFKGRGACFGGTGLGKTFIMAEVAHQMAKKIEGNILFFAPLGVAKQTIREWQTMGWYLKYITDESGIEEGQRFYITNYERLGNFNSENWEVIILDESSILKNLTGKTKQALIEFRTNIPYRFCATATPAPNDITEIGNHADFLGISTPFEMRSNFFTYDSNSRDKHGGKGNAWRLKKHAVKTFYQWMASWAIAFNMPSDLGFPDGDFVLPELNVTHITVNSEYTPEGMLPGFGVQTISATEINKVRRATLKDRCDLIAEKVNSSDEIWLIWCGLNDEADYLSSIIPDSVNVYGAMDADKKADLLLDFADGKIRVLITKAKIAGMGMNFQKCHNVFFAGLDYSWEYYYQAIRRVYRFGQKYPVNVYIVTSKQESSIVNSVLDKEKEALKMTENLIQAARTYTLEELRQSYRKEWQYLKDEKSGRNWRMLLGDSTERIKEIPDNSIDIQIESPPFGSDLFVYSDTPRDLSNSRNNAEFMEHYRFIVREKLRILKPGRLSCIHIQDLRSYKSLDGFIGRKDLSGDIIQLFQEEGWIFWQRITINKNPQIQAIRLKAQDLLFATLKKDSTKLAGGFADYMLIFKKPGDSEVPVKPMDNGEMNEEDWIRLAHPVWNHIKETAVLNTAVAKGQQDEKHMCPLQLPLIYDCLRLWSNPGEVVFSPFGGIGSEGYEAVKNGRKFIGIELKPEYWKVACHNLNNAEKLKGQTLFDWAAEQNGDNE